jgi:hypothetical protein
MGFLLSSAIKHKIAASVIIGALSLGTAISTFASQDMLPGQSQDEVTISQTAEETVVPTATPEGELEATATPTPESEAEPTATATPEASEATPTPTPESEPEATATPEDDETGPRDVVGIPDDNPVKVPEDGDGVCEKGETVIKTTPSGNLVNVPCRAVKTPEPSDEEETEDE